MQAAFADHDSPDLCCMCAEVDPELQGKPNQECEAIRESLLAGIRGLKLPGNFLDELVDQLGGASQVAEMTGRRRVPWAPLHLLMPCRPSARAHTYCVCLCVA